MTHNAEVVHKMFFNSLIKFNELYRAVEKNLRSSNKVLLSNLHNVPTLLPPNFTVPNTERTTYNFLVVFFFYVVHVLFLNKKKYSTNLKIWGP